MGIGIGVGIGLWIGQFGSAGPSLKLSALTVGENASAGTVVGTLSVANAPDGVTYTYALTSDPSGFFEIATATLQTAAGVDLDYETATSHTIEVRATGSDASEIVQSFVVSVTDVSFAGGYWDDSDMWDDTLTWTEAA